MKAPATTAALLVALVLAGCTVPEPPAPDFDGEAAYEYVDGLVWDGDALRDRVPGSAGHADTAEWLAQRLVAPGWDVAIESFSGEDYLEYDAGAVAAYRDGADCDDRRDDVANLTFRNVVARWDGPGDDVFLLGAHWDQKKHASHDPDAREAVVPGANDGASGVGVLIQLAWHVAAGDIEPRSDLRIVLFDGEDGFEDCHPLAGSIHHATFHAHDTTQMLLLDMVGDPEARFIRERSSHQAAPWLLDAVWDAAEVHVPGNLVPLPEGAQAHCSVLDDHTPFVERGVPAVDFIDFGRGYDPDDHRRCAFPPWWHTTEDTMDHVDAAMLGSVGAMVWTVLEDPAAYAPA